MKICMPTPRNPTIGTIRSFTQLHHPFHFESHQVFHPTTPSFPTQPFTLKKVGMKKQQAKKVMEAVLLKDYEQLGALNVRVYGNRGQGWSKEACIESLDDYKGPCTIRLARNYCTVEDIGCPDCLKALVALATEDTSETPAPFDFDNPNPNPNPNPNSNSNSNPNCNYSCSCCLPFP